MMESHNPNSLDRGRTERGSYSRPTDLSSPLFDESLRPSSSKSRNICSFARLFAQVTSSTVALPEKKYLGEGENYVTFNDVILPVA